MTPEPNMLVLLANTKAYLTTVGGEHSSDPEVWCVEAGLQYRNTWVRWVEEYGDDFVSWFTRNLSLGEIERAAIDRMFWGAVKRALSSEAPNASQMNVWADIQGYKKEKPQRNELPVLSTDGAMDELAKLPRDVLLAVLAYQKSLQDEKAG